MDWRGHQQSSLAGLGKDSRLGTDIKGGANLMQIQGQVERVKSECQPISKEALTPPGKCVEGLRLLTNIKFSVV